MISSTFSMSIILQDRLVLNQTEWLYNWITLEIIAYQYYVEGDMLTELNWEEWLVSWNLLCNGD